METDQTAEQLGLISRVWRYWQTRGAWVEGLGSAESALARGHGDRSHDRGETLYAAAAFSSALGEQDAAKAYAEESLSIFLDLGDRGKAADTLGGLGVIAANLGDYAEASRLQEEAIVYARHAGSSNFASAIARLADTTLRRGDNERARELTEKALTFFRELGYEREIAWTLYNLALCCFRSGRDEEASVAAKESLTLCHAVRDIETLAWNFLLLAAQAAGRGDARIGASLQGVAELLSDQVGLVFTGVEAELHENTMIELRKTLGQERYEVAMADGRALSLDEAVEHALASLD